MSKLNKAVILITIFASFFGFLSCEKGNSSGIPYAYVDIYININEPAFFNLSAVGGFEYINGGSQGIVLYRKSNDEIVAFDRHCTFNVEQNCRVAVDSTFIFLHDTCCNSSFFLMDGTVNQGPATLPLKFYNVDFDGSNLHIYN